MAKRNMENCRFIGSLTNYTNTSPGIPTVNDGETGYSLFLVEPSLTTFCGTLFRDKPVRKKGP